MGMANLDDGKHKNETTFGDTIGATRSESLRIHSMSALS